MKVKNRNFTSLASHSLTRLQWRGSANPLQYKHVTHNTEIYRCSSQKHVTHYTEFIKWETCYTLHWIDQVRNMLHITLNWSGEKHVTHYTQLIKSETCYTLHWIDQVRNMLHITLNWSSQRQKRSVFLLPTLPHRYIYIYPTITAIFDRSRPAVYTISIYDRLYTTEWRRR